MSVKWVVRIRKSVRILLNSAAQRFITDILPDLPLQFCVVFIVSTIVFEGGFASNPTENKGFFIGRTLLCLLLLVIIIWVLIGLENTGKAGVSKRVSVSQNIPLIVRIALTLFIALLGLFLSGYVVHLDELKEKDQKLEWSRFTSKGIDIGVLVDSEPEVEHQEVNITGTVLSDTDLKLLFALPRYLKVALGDICALKGEIYEPESFEDFDYKKYLENKRVYRIMRVESGECSPQDEASLWMRFKTGVVGIKSYFIRKIDRSVPEPQSSLLAGIIFGQKRPFSDEFDGAISDAGVSHVVAASGYNISFVVGIASSILGFLDQRKRIVGATIFVWIYCIMSGLSPSIVRAGLMFTIAKGFSYFGFYIPLLNIMVFTLFIFTLIDPRIPFDVGFQLSYLATLGLIYVLPYLQSLAEKLDMKGLAGSVVLPTLACTLTTLPVTIITFKKLPLLSILVNALVLPVIDSVLILGVCAIGLYYTFPAFSKIIYMIIWFQLKYFEQVVLYFGKISWGAISF